MQTPTNHEADFYRAISAQIRELWGDRSASESLVAARAVIPIDSDVLASLENSALIQIVSATCEMPSD